MRLNSETILFGICSWLPQGLNMAISLASKWCLPILLTSREQSPEAAELNIDLTKCNDFMDFINFINLTHLINLIHLIQLLLSISSCLAAGKTGWFFQCFLNLCWVLSGAARRRWTRQRSSGEARTGWPCSRQKGSSHFEGKLFLKENLI